MKVLLVISMMALFGSATFAQEKFENTLTYNDEVGSPEATLECLDFVAGHWQGKAFGGIVEEVWTPPLGGSMMCAFKLVVDNQVQFYELCTLSEENKTLILRLKHFRGDLKGWEEKDETVDFRLVKVEPGKVYFDGFTFEKVSHDEINLYVVLEEKGKKEEMRFNYHRFEGGTPLD
ncbi:MAG: DUF6265 family protein [Draconibacterium sp.]